jgi:dihydrofolate synthase/folylpolyglutamate synthase
MSDPTKPTKTGSDAILARLLALHPKIIDLSLDRMHGILARLDHPETRLPPVIHIAGTNGKGSTLAMLRAGLESTGSRVHAYTSPHLAQFHERIRIAGALIDEDALAALLEECETANNGMPITFFEITTAAALLAYARTPADWLLLEVGMGGRLDATNVVESPRLTAITPVSYDHQAYLGDSLAAIAGEKAGILKPGVPCVVAEQAPEALAVIETRAAQVEAPLIVAGRQFTAREEAGQILFEDEAGSLALPRPTLLGPHQIVNAATALAALRTLRFDDAACMAAMIKAEWPARLQTLRQGPLVALCADAEVQLWLDGSHNEAAAAAIAAFFTDLAAQSPAPLQLVCGMLETKNTNAFFSKLAGIAEGVHTVTIPGAAASLSAAALGEAARGAGLPAEAHMSLETAVLAAARAAGTGGRVLICGSLYLAGEVLRNNS